MCHRTLLSPVLLLLFLTCELFAQETGARFESPYFDFAREADSLAYKAAVQPVPDYVDDNMLYYCREGVYHGRQIVLKGVTTEGLLQTVYRRTPARMVMEAGLPSGRWIAEIIIPDPNDELLDQTLREAVEERLGIRGSKADRMVPVFRLAAREGRSIGFAEADGSVVRWTQEDGKISGEGLTMGMLASVLEHVTNEQPVLNELHGSDRYAIDLYWEAGNIDDLRSQLRRYGIDLTDAQEEVELMVIRSGRVP